MRIQACTKRPALPVALLLAACGSGDPQRTAGAAIRPLDEEVTSLEGKDSSGIGTFTDVFARRNGQWVAVASHTSEVKPTGE